MSEPIKINGIPIVWVSELAADQGIDWPKVKVGHSPACECEACRLKESVRAGSAENPVVLQPEPRPS